jgi:hypothetical protein
MRVANLDYLGMSGITQVSKVSSSPTTGAGYCPGGAEVSEQTDEEPIGWRVWYRFANSRPFDKHFETKGVCETTLYATQSEADARKRAIIDEHGRAQVTANTSPVYVPKATQTKRSKKRQLNAASAWPVMTKRLTR